MEATTLERPGRLAVAGALLGALGVGGWLMLLLLAACAYAGFAHGAIGGPAESRLQVGVAAMVALAGIGVAARLLTVPRTATAWSGVGLLALFGLWSAFSMAWSVAPDQTWLATNRAIAYAALAGLGLLAGGSVRRAARLTALAIALIVLLVALYALGGKLAPGLSLPGINLNHTAQFQRLREPIGYWNALGLLCVIATPTCIWGAADRDWPGGLRIGALLALTVLLVTIALTYSRGAVIAYLVVVAVMVGVGPDRLRRLAVALIAAIAAAPAVAFTFSRHDLTADNLPVSARSGDGLALALVLAVTLLALGFAARAALAAESRVEWTPAHSRTAWRSLAVLLGVGLVAGTLALVGSHRGLTGTISHQWQQFKKAKGTSSQPGRLLSTNSSNRWIWWSEAAGAFSDKPIRGWGAGSFPVVHYLYRQHPAPVRSTHSVELQFLSETGLIGAALGLGGLALLGGAAVRGVRRSTGAERSARLVLVAIAAAWAVHSAYDWDWEIPAVTAPALIAAGVAAAPLRRRGLSPAEPPRSGESPRWLIAAGAALIAAALTISAVTPQLAESRRLDALVAADQGASQLPQAQSTADLARRLNPFAVEELVAEASIAHRRGDDSAAVQLLAKAARVQPDNPEVWRRLTPFYLQFDAARIVNHAILEWSRTDPLFFRLSPPALFGSAYAVAVSPYHSPTAFGTPIPSQAQVAASLPAGGP